MATDGPRRPLDDPGERRTDRQPDPFPRRIAGDLMRDPDDVPGNLDRSDAEWLADATDDFGTQAAEQDRQRQADGDGQHQQDQQDQQDQQRADDDRQRADDDRQRADDDRQRADDRRRQAEEEERTAEQERERDRAREDEEDPAVDPASVAASAVAVASAAAEHEPNTLADRPSDIEAGMDPDAYRRWQEPGIVPTREELGQALNGEPDADGQPGRRQAGREEDYAGRHRAEDGSAPDSEHWAPPAAEARADWDGTERPFAEQARQGGAAPARDAANERSRSSAEIGKTVAAGGLAATGRVVGSADNLIEAASPTGRPGQSQSWGTGRIRKPGASALRKTVSVALSGHGRASDAARAPERAPQASPHSGAHTPGQFHQRMQQQQQEQHRQRGG